MFKASATRKILPVIIIKSVFEAAFFADVIASDMLLYLFPCSPIAVAEVYSSFTEAEMN